MKTGEWENGKKQEIMGLTETQILAYIRSE